MTYLRSMDDVINYLKLGDKVPFDSIVIVFNSTDEYHDFVRQYYDDFFKEYYNFGELLNDSQINRYSQFGIRLVINTENITSRTHSKMVWNWGYCSYDYYKNNGYQVFAIYSELNSRKIESATDQEVSDFLFTEKLAI